MANFYQVKFVFQYTVYRQRFKDKYNISYRGINIVITQINSVMLAGVIPDLVLWE